MKPRLLDLFCGAGGASMGYHRAGFDVVGVDINPQPNYPFKFIQADALKFLLEEWRWYDVFHASPPCQAFTNAQKLRGNTHPNYVRATRNAFSLIWFRSCYENSGRGLSHYVIENVPGSPLKQPIEMCGSMFGLGTYRHRLFESSFLITPPNHPEHTAPTAKMGRKPKPGEFMHVVGNFSGVARAREAMGIDWMTRDELREAIPPAYTEHIGRQRMNAMEAAA